MQHNRSKAAAKTAWSTIQDLGRTGMYCVKCIIFFSDSHEQVHTTIDSQDTKEHL